MAAHAQHHIKVHKQQDAQGRASTRFAELPDPAARLEEVAAMLGLGPDVAADMMAAAQGWPAARVQQLLADCQGPEAQAREQEQERERGEQRQEAASEQAPAANDSSKAAGNGHSSNGNGSNGSGSGGGSGGTRGEAGKRLVGSGH